MTALSDAVADYLALRNSLGHKLADAARLLPRFAAWMDSTGHVTVTTALALTWAQLPDARPGSVVWPRRLTAVRGFARYLAGLDPATQVPPQGVLVARHRWRPPFIYNANDITALLDGARHLRSSLRAATYETLFGLLAVTGMRVGEAIRLDVADVDLDERAVVLVRQSKFGKSRYLPLHESTTARLRAYADRRSEFHPRRGNPSFFVSLTGKRLIYVSVHDVFDGIRTRNRIGTTSNTPPRIHDLRHTFAVTTLLEWYRDGVDVASRVPWLATYLGHHDPRSTYWYLSAAPELLALAANRIDITSAPVPS